MTWFISLLTILSLFNANPNGNLYAKTMEVTAITVVSEETQMITAEDFNGFQWIFESNEDLDVGDYVACVMYDNATEIIFDDVVMSAKYEDLETKYKIEYVYVGEELTSETDELIS